MSDKEQIYTVTLVLDNYDEVEISYGEGVMDNVIEKVTGAVRSGDLFSSEDICDINLSNGVSLDYLACRRVIGVRY